VSSVRYTLRAARAEDFSYLYELHVRSMRAYVEQTWGWDEDVQRAMFRDAYDPAELMVIVRDGKDVGVLGFDHTAEPPFLKLIEIDPAAQRQGLGSKVVGDLIAGARARGRRLRLRVLKVNPARRLYERLGFHFAGETDTHVSMETA
jgi:ribosomal protein S18 acetylase RimI-like enzyme